MDIPQPTLHRLLNGATSNPTVMTLLPIAEYFEISFDQLLGIEPLKIDSANVQNFQSRKSFQVPIIPWEEVYDHKNFLLEVSNKNWDNWTVTNLKFQANAFGLQILSRGFPIPFNQQSIQIVESCEKIESVEASSIVIVCSSKTKGAHIKKLIVDGSTKWLLPIHERLPIECFNKDWILCGVIRQHILIENSGE